MRSLAISFGQSSPRTVAFQGGSVSVEETTYFGNSFSLSAYSPSAVGAEGLHRRVGAPAEQEGLRVLRLLELESGKLGTAVEVHGQPCT